eukprot:TRINITY_DN10980_c0_g1_i1.p1 TRINITY_DN10980_c0_g1~~TRINITY_DN10980_c0_g1_i1.p1  ORF type:complete len:112 (+),score=18.13 TRINITY_DN10980_c0_g1_i1:157-492(+)
MDYLDADDDRLVDSKGNQQRRDNVQFVPFREFEHQGASRIAKETLEEVPGQFSSFMRLHNIAPMKHDASAPGRGGAPAYQQEQKEGVPAPSAYAPQYQSDVDSHLRHRRTG